MLKTSKQAKIKHLSLNSEKKLETKIKKNEQKVMTYYWQILLWNCNYYTEFSMYLSFYLKNCFIKLDINYLYHNGRFNKSIKYIFLYSYKVIFSWSGKL